MLGIPIFPKIESLFDLGQSLLDMLLKLSSLAHVFKHLSADVYGFATYASPEDFVLNLGLRMIDVVVPLRVIGTIFR